MASTYLTRTSDTATNVNKYTFSAWIKRSLLTSSFQPIFGGTGSTLANYHDSLFFSNSTDKFIYQGATNGSTEVNLQTSASYRDVSAWYHVVVAYDSTQSTASNRVKIYINGVQETSFSTETYPAQNRGAYANGRDSSTITISKIQSDAVYFDGSMSHIHFIDGTAYDASAFGETDATTGEWKIKTSPSVTYGNNGFFILKDGNTITDQSANSNNFSLGGGTLTKTEDCPSNVFCTMNSLTASSYSTLSKGNTETKGASGADNGNVISTFAPNSGKWYCESLVQTAVPTAYPSVGLGQVSDANFGTVLNSTVGMVGYNSAQSGFLRPDGRKYSNNTEASWTSTTFGTNDILMFALDCDNGAFYIGKNGTWINSGNPNSGSSKTNAFLTWTPANEQGQAFASRDYNNSVLQWNFGNGFFGTTAVSSAGTNASGIGIFEYDVPSGYTALSTKGLNL